MTFNKPAMSFKQSKQACRLPRETPFCRIPGRTERVGLMESIAETYTLTQAKEPASGKLPNAAGDADQGSVTTWGGLKREGTCV